MSRRLRRYLKHASMASAGSGTVADIFPLIVSRSVQLVRENSPMILLSRHYDFASPRNDLPRPYQHPQYLSLMPRDIELEMLIDGCENVPTGMRIRSAQCSHLLETGDILRVEMTVILTNISLCRTTLSADRV